jgi:hypothetical protein
MTSVNRQHFETTPALFVRFLYVSRKWSESD